MPRRPAATLALALLAATAQAAPPRPARGRFVTHNYALTFPAPAGATYCPIAGDWTGSDHGTVLFLRPPRDCGGAGYPSSSRGFTPDATPRIEVYYDWAPDEEDAPARPCRRVGRIRFLREAVPLCRVRRGALTGVEATGLYTATGRAEAVATLLTTGGRRARDWDTFRRWVGRVRPCTVTWPWPDGRKEVFGSGPACPAEGSFY